MALVEQIPLTKACGSQCNREALYSPFVPLQYTEVGVILCKIIRKEKEFKRIDDSLVEVVKQGKETFKKHYSYLEDHDFYYLATVLDPRIKTRWIKENIETPDEVIDRIRKLLKATYPLPDSPLPQNS